MRSLLKKVSQNGLKLHVLEKPLKMVTHQSTLHHVEIPVPSGIHIIEQIWHSNTTDKSCHRSKCPTLGANCCTGVVFGQSSLLFVLWAFIFKWHCQLSTQLSVSLLSNLAILICRRWSYSLPYDLHPIQFTP